MRSFLRRLAPVVAGVLCGFDRVVFKGRLPQLYSPEGMNCYAAANHVRLLDFKPHAKKGHFPKSAVATPPVLPRDSIGGPIVG